MPIIANKTQPIDVLFGVKDLVLDADVVKFYNSENKIIKEFDFKTLNIRTNLNGAVQEGVTQEELRESKSDPVIRLAFTSDEAIDNIINQLTKLRDAKMLFNRFTYTDVLEDTINYYKQDPNMRRAVDKESSACSYYDAENNTMCAVGRYLKHPEKFEKSVTDEMDLDFNMLIDDTEFEHEEDPYEVLFNESAAHLRNRKFWETLQQLHDSNSCWNKQGLTPYGIEKYKELAELAESLDAEMTAKCKECFGERFILAHTGEKLPCNTCGAL